jgi:hypothetical protein
MYSGYIAGLSHSKGQDEGKYPHGRSLSNGLQPVLKLCAIAGVVPLNHFNKFLFFDKSTKLIWNRSHELTMKGVSPEIAIQKYLFVLYCIALLTAEGGSLENIKKKNAVSIKLSVLRIDLMRLPCYLQSHLLLL